jgi:hypothetical protein
MGLRAECVMGFLWFWARVLVLDFKIQVQVNLK